MPRYKSHRHRVNTPNSVVLKRRIKRSQIPAFRDKYAKKQKYICPICERSLKNLTQTLDHCHKTGRLRGTLCNNCNGLEGKLTAIIARLDVSGIGFDKIIENIFNWRHPSNLKKPIHPNAETLTEQKLRQKKRAATLRRRNKLNKKK